MRPKPSADGPAEPEFSVFDSGYDDEPAQSSVPSGQRSDAPATEPVPLPVPAVSGRRAIVAVAVAVLAVGAAGVLHHDRARPSVRTTVVSTPGLVTAGLSGCPVGRTCAYGNLADSSQLLPFVQEYLPQAEQVSSSIVFDSTSVEYYRGLLVASLPSGITLTIAVDFDPTTTAVIPARQSPLPGTGPADVLLVRPGSMTGSSVSVSAHVPAGVAVPVQALQKLVADQNLQRPQS